MQVSVEESGAIERKVTVCVPRGEVDREIKKRLHKVAQGARIDGFRPGKAPQNLIQSRYGAQIANEVVNDTITESYRAAMVKEEIVPAGLLSIEPKPFVADDDAGGDLSYVATIELYPEIPRPTLDGESLEKSICTVTAADVDRTLENIRNNAAEFVARDGQSQTGDRLTVDFGGTIDGVAFAGGARDGHQFVIGDARRGGYLGDAVHSKFESALTGVTVGATKKITVAFPADYPAPDVAGKTAQFNVTVQAVEMPVLPEVDDAFAEKLGIKDGGVAKMRAEIEESLNRELVTKLRSVMRGRVMDALLKINVITAPTALVESEIDRCLQRITDRMQAQGGKVVDADLPARDHLREDAKRQVMLGLIMRGVMDAHDLKPDPQAVRARVAEMAAGYEDGTAMMDWYHADPTRLQPIEAELLDEQVVAKMIATARVTEKKVSFAELMAGE